MNNNRLKISDKCEEFMLNGYVVFENILSDKEVNNLRQIIENILDNDLTQGNNEPEFLPDVMRTNKYLFEITQNTKLQSALKTILGDEYVHFDETSVHDSFYAGWHKDTSSPEKRGYNFFWNPQFNVVQAAIYLQDNTENGGGLDVVPGTHMEVDWRVRKSIMEARINQGITDHAVNDKSLKLEIRRIIKNIVNIATFGNVDGFMKTIRKIKAKIKYLDLPIPGLKMTQEERLFCRSVSVGSKAGDLILFNLRTMHRATPKTGNESTTKRKLAIFFTCGTNNAESMVYHEWLKEYSDKQKLSPMTSKELKEYFERKIAGHSIG